MSGKKDQGSSHAIGQVPSQGFTLLETVLAFGIAAGMLLIVLYFYQQVSTSRRALLEETEKMAAIRRIMDRLTTELRGAVKDDYIQIGLIGGPDFLQVVTTRLPPLNQWNLAEDESDPSFRPRSDLVEVGYLLDAATGETNTVNGLLRWEEPFLESVALLEDESGMTDDSTSITNLVATSSTDTDIDTATDTDTTYLEEESEEPSIVEQAPVISQIKHIRFRYYDGLSWWDFWDFIDLPLGVEISLSSEMVTVPGEEEDFLEDDFLFEEEDEDDPFTSASEYEDEYRPEVFRRIVYLPGSLSSFQAMESGDTNEIGFLEDLVP